MVRECWLLGPGYCLVGGADVEAGGVMRWLQSNERTLELWEILLRGFVEYSDVWVKLDDERVDVKLS